MSNGNTTDLGIFSELLGEMHTHVFAVKSSEFAPITLPLLWREYLAFALAIYYQCEICEEYHTKAIKRLLEKAAKAGEEAGQWDWETVIVKTVTFTRLKGADISPREWGEWVESWTRFENFHETRSDFPLRYIAFVVALARADEKLLTHEWYEFINKEGGKDGFAGAVRDIVKVMAYMKAATAINRVRPILKKLFVMNGTTFNL